MAAHADAAAAGVLRSAGILHLLAGRRRNRGREAHAAEEGRRRCRMVRVEAARRLQHEYHPRIS